MLTEVVMRLEDMPVDNFFSIASSNIFLFLQQFLNSVQEKFECVCCQELVCKPVTTECKHSVCHQCLLGSFKAEVFSCPACRYDLGRDYTMKVNKPLDQVLIKLFPGYDRTR